MQCSFSTSCLHRGTMTFKSNWVEDFSSFDGKTQVEVEWGLSDGLSKLMLWIFICPDKIKWRNQIYLSEIFASEKVRIVGICILLSLSSIVFFICFSFGSRKEKTLVMSFCSQFLRTIKRILSFIFNVSYLCVTLHFTSTLQIFCLFKYLFFFWQEVFSSVTHL